ncbi:MAG TPA: hypothetical protein VNW52_01440 [Burkholderiaceae bacterium]|nr:hypothetical protein [Burkholderiaceae bacterium]
MSPNFTALCYLHAFDHRLPIQDGLAFEKILRTYRLDYSVKSLARIDDFLDELRTGKKVREDTYLDDPATQNLLYLLNFYVGEVIARSLKSQAHWYTFKEVQDIDPMSKVSGPAFENSVTLGFPQHAISVTKPWFRPLISLTSRLFSEHVEKSVLFSAGIMLPLEYQTGPASELPLPPSPAPAWPIDVAAQFEQSPQLLSELGMTAPAWAKDDKLRLLFDNQIKIMREGCVVWGAVVQANANLFVSNSDDGAPLDVLYDPRGRLSPEDLIALAQSVYALKEKRPSDPALIPLYDHFRNGFTRAIGLDVPSTFVPYPLKVSSTYFERKNFPGRKLAQHVIPLLISDIYLGLVVPLPSRLWPAELLAQWAPKPGEHTSAPALALCEREAAQNDADSIEAVTRLNAPGNGPRAANPSYSAAYDVRKMGAAPSISINQTEDAVAQVLTQRVAAAQVQKPRRDIELPVELMDKIIHIDKGEKFRAYKLNIPFFLVILGVSTMAFAKLSPSLSQRGSVGILISGVVLLLAGLYKAYKAVER